MTEPILLNQFGKPLKEQIEDCLRPSIYLPAYGSGLTEGEIGAILSDLNASSCALIDFVEGELDEESFLDAVEATGIDIDDYIETGLSNLDFKLGI